MQYTETTRPFTASIDSMDSYICWGSSDVALGEALSNDPEMIDNNDSNSMDIAFDPILQDNVTTETLDILLQDVPRQFGDEGNMLIEPPVQVLWETPENPCAHCVLGSYSCRRIKEGFQRGCCTSCVALGLTCSFDRLSKNPDTYNGSTEIAWPEANFDPANAMSLEELSESFRPSVSCSLAGSINQPAASSDNAALACARPGTPPPKIGARFSRECVRTLKNWLLTHNRHPYPSDEEKEMLSRKTGLNRTQITNWLANARRRGKAQPPRPTSPHIRNLSTSIDIPQRRGTPVMEAMNPLQRWEHSPPEHEPASVSAIARAVTASGSSATSVLLNSPFSFNYTDDSTNISLYNQSSASSVHTSQSGGSLASGFSYGTQNSWGSLGSAHLSNRGRRRRHRRIPMKEAVFKNDIVAPPKTFQCTFCTETFRTKYDWQRHEKSLHLSLERWVCAPNGPRAINPDNGVLCCIFCGEENPSDAHIDAHNHTVCQERPKEERTFYRKDHLNQHLRLVHDVKFLDWAMKGWKATMPEIRSRCGFCNIILDTWTTRVSHLAEHFKTGYSMADWKGDWGFEPPVLDMIENSMPPYLIHHSRLSTNPQTSCNLPPASPRNAYELIKLELAYFNTNHWSQHGRAPTDMDMMLEGCRIIFASELLSLQGIATQPSWLRDLIMSKSLIAQKARFGPLRGAAENRLQILKINGKDNLFEECPMETQLRLFVKSKQLLGLTTMDDELQEEACRIVGRVEEVCNYPSEAVANWLLRMIRSSTEWLPEFRKRAHLPRSEDMQQSTIRSTDPTSIDSTIHNYSRLESELADFLKQQQRSGVEPTDEDLQREARMIIYEFDDGWNQTVADNLDWLAAFRDRNGQAGKCLDQGESSGLSEAYSSAQSPFMSSSLEFEQGLEEYLEIFMTQHGSLPCDETLQTTAREMTNHTTTAAEELAFLGIFKERVSQNVRDGMSMTPANGSVGAEVGLPGAMPASLDPDISDEDFSKILSSMNIEILTKEAGTGVYENYADRGANTALTKPPEDLGHSLFFDI